jgi:hypothetical protein
MPKNPFPMPQTIQSAGIEAHMKRQDECDADHRGEHLPSGESPLAYSPDLDWHRNYHIREEYRRQEGEVQGKSTYAQGTVFAPGRARPMDPPKED